MKQIYFGQIEQEAVEEYLFYTTPQLRKSFLFKRFIEPAVKKIVAHYSYTIYNLENIDDLKDELYSHAMEALHYHYDPRKGSAFSYLSNIVKNKCIEYIRNYKKETSPDYIEFLKNNETATVYNRADILIQENEFMSDLLKKLRVIRFQKEEYIILTECVIKLIEDRDVLPIENKKKVIILLHEMSNIDKKVIALFLNKLKQHYLQFKNDHLNGEEI